MSLADAEQYLKQGIAFADQGDHDHAIAAFDEAIRLKPDYALAYCHRGRVYATKNALSRAIMEYDQAIALNPQLAEAYNGRGLSRFNQGLVEAMHSTSSLAQAVVANGLLSSGVYLNPLQIQPNAEVIDAALSDLNRAIQLNPFLAKAHLNRGIIYARTGDENAAIENFTKAIAVAQQTSEPKVGAMAYSSRGFFYSIRDDLDAAIADISKAIELNPDTVSYHNRGYSYSLQGDFAQAIADFTEALRLDPDFLSSLYSRAYTYRRTRQHAQAVSDYQRLLAVEPNYSGAASMRLYILRRRIASMFGSLFNR